MGAKSRVHVVWQVKGKKHVKLHCGRELGSVARVYEPGQIYNNKFAVWPCYICLLRYVSRRRRSQSPGSEGSSPKELEKGRVADGGGSSQAPPSQPPNTVE